MSKNNYFIYVVQLVAYGVTNGENNPIQVPQMNEYNTLYQNDLRHILKLIQGMKVQQNSELGQIQ